MCLSIVSSDQSSCCFPVPVLTTEVSSKALLLAYFKALRVRSQLYESKSTKAPWWPTSDYGSLPVTTHPVLATLYRPPDHRPKAADTGSRKQHRTGGTNAEQTPDFFSSPAGVPLASWFWLPCIVTPNHLENHKCKGGLKISSSTFVNAG